jgi:hypothetical protein
MAGKSIKPSGTAKDRVAQEVAQGAEMAPDIANELERMRGEQKKHVVENTAGVEVDDLSEVEPLQSIEKAAGELLNFDMPTSYVFELYDGREIEMGPPPVPHMLIVPKMFAERKDLNPIQADAELKMARILLYVRRVGNQRLTLMQTWGEVKKLAQELGELGMRSCYEVYAECWSDYTPTGWKFVKKSVSSKNSATQSRS